MPGEGEPPGGVISELRPILVWGVIAAITLVVLARRGVIAPASLNAVDRRRLERGSWLFWLGSAFLIYCLMVVGSAFGIAATDALDWAPESLPAQSLITWGAYAVALAGAAALLLSRRREMTNAGFTIHGHDAWMGVGAYVLAFPIVTVVLLVAGAVADTIRGAPSDPISHNLLAELVASERDLAWWAMVGAVVLAAPIVEEVIYRGCLQSSIRAAGRSATSAVLVTAAIFAAAHATSVRPEALVGLFVLGVGFGLIFERTGRIGTAIVMHAAFNAANIVQAVLIK